MKKFICLLALIAMTFPVAHASFSDVSESYDYNNAVNYVQQRSLVQGYEDGTYRPDNQITRAEFTKIIIGARFTQDEIDNCVPTKNFPDVKSDKWYAKYVCVAKNEGIIAGFQDGTFKPINNITFAEAAKIVANSYGLEPVGEADSEAHWYLPFVDALYLQAAVPPSITDYKVPITRGEMAETIFGVETEQGYVPGDGGGTGDNSVDNAGDDSTDDSADDSADNPADDSANDTSDNPPAAPDYKTSSSKSEITFSRVIDTSDDSSGDLLTYKLNINIKISGYIQEIDPTTSLLNMTLDRVFSFKNSKVTWTITGSEKRESEYCTFLYEIDGSGNKPISELNIDSGDEKRTMIPTEGWGSWVLAYADPGFYTNTPELSLEGHVLIPLVETITTTKMTSHSICGDYYNNEMVKVETKNFAIEPVFPLKLNTLNITQKNHSGDLEVYEDSFDSPEGATATFEQAGLFIPLDMPYETGKWNVSWDLHLP
ncbi:MAG: S-layer homology domain-containing protein [Candidatus Gracilibacteria bacterium]|jgi:hypothetical protein